MTPEEYRLLIPQYLSSGLEPAETLVFEERMAVDERLRMEVEELRELWEGLALAPAEQPSPALRARFYRRLNALDRPAARFAWNLGPLAQVALALFIFVLGVVLGRVKMGESGRAEEMAQMSAQVQSLREAVALSLLDRHSATSRLEGVSWSSQVDRPNGELLAALVAALNHDSNTNVRLSALNALERFGDNAAVDKALMDSIPLQDSPLVQIALIDSLVHIHNRAAAPELKKLTADAGANPAVRQRAQWGLKKLSFE
jgi:hypothetical protein